MFYITVKVKMYDTDALSRKKLCSVQVYRQTRFNSVLKVDSYIVYRIC